MGVPTGSHDEKAVSSFGSANSKLRLRDRVARFGFQDQGDLRFLDINRRKQMSHQSVIDRVYIFLNQR